mmetsp:Transcript_49392/g.123874  ORF Transcript_49392/g.123874 Transcript_49392/m.123874 type:complete len:96 (+) Transcript_49392:468-755(+)
MGRNVARRATNAATSNKKSSVSEAIDEADEPSVQVRTVSLMCRHLPPSHPRDAGEPCCPSHGHAQQTRHTGDLCRLRRAGTAHEKRSSVSLSSST